MPITVTVLIGSVFANLIVALINTFNKEKQMIKEGGAPLPTSSYVFLIVKYLIWAGSVAVFYNFNVYSPDTLLHWGVFSMGIIIVTYLMATFIEVLIRVIMVFVLTKLKKRKIAKESTTE